MVNQLQDVDEALEQSESSSEVDQLLTDGGERRDDDRARDRRRPPPWWYEDMWRRFPPWWHETPEEYEDEPGSSERRRDRRPPGEDFETSERADVESRRMPPWRYGRWTGDSPDEEIPGEMERELRDLRDEHLEVLDDLRVKHRDLKEAHLTELDSLISRYRDILDERDITEELENEYEDLLDEHISLLEDMAEEESRGILTRTGIGLGTLALGYITAEIYLPDENVLVFYAQAPEIYSGSPEVGIVTAGLPALGLYALGKAYQKQKNYSEIREELNEYRNMRENL